MPSLEQIQPNEHKNIPGLMPEETPKQRRTVFETRGKEITEDRAKKEKFNEYQEKMRGATIDKLKDFIIWCNESIKTDPAYKDEYHDLQAEAAKLILSKIGIEKASGTLNAPQSKIDINTVINLIGARMIELQAEMKKAQKQEFQKEASELQQKIKELDEIRQKADSLFPFINP